MKYQENNQVKRQFQPGIQTAIDGWDIPGAPEWANGALDVKRLAMEETENGATIDEIMISTDDENRSGDTIVSTGVHFENYFKNPVVGWNHGFSAIDFPIGRTLSLETKAGEGIVARWKWPPWKSENEKEGIERVDDIHRLWSGRFINAASIWIQIMKAEPKEGHQDDFWPPLIIHESDMIEWALVYIGRNQNAVRNSMKQLAEHNYLKRLERRFRKKEARLNVENYNPGGEVRNIIVPLSGFKSAHEELDKLNKSLNILKGKFHDTRRA